MSLYSTPPPARSVRDDKATLLVCWWCTMFAMVVILFRVCGRYIRSEKLFREDWIAFACIIPLLCRMALVHIVLIYGTNNAITTGLTDLEIYHRSIGSKVVLVSRIFYAATLWMLKLTISEFFKRLTWNIWTSSHEMMLRSIRWFLLLSFVAVIIADLTECYPFTHYWQVAPDPGPQCRQGYAQLLTMGTVNVITDLLLVVFPIPIIIRSKFGAKRKSQLVLLFSLSLLPAGTTLYRLPNIIERAGGQQYRSLLASLEILLATGVANALVLGSFVRDRGVKKQRFKFGSITDSVERSGSRRGTPSRQRYWGSDDDLVRDLGLGIDPELRGSTPDPRPAPMATAGSVLVKSHQMIGNNWQYHGENSDTSDELNLIIKLDKPDSRREPSNIITPRKMSFFDVGGLLDDDQSHRFSQRTIGSDGESSMFARTPSHYSHEHIAGLSPPPPRRGSTVLLQDIGGLLAPRRRGGVVQTARTFELQPIKQEDSPHLQPVLSKTLPQISPNELQDVGGLLK